MDNSIPVENPKVLIASANPLFRKGLENMVLERYGQTAMIQSTQTTSETLAVMESWQPDLVIVDYDDKSVSRTEFLHQFVAGDSTMQVVLVSLQASGGVVVYDRRTLTPAQVQDWFSTSSSSLQSSETPITKRSSSMKHYAFAGVLVLVLTFLVDLFLSTSRLLPVQASLQAKPIDRLFDLEIIAISFLFSLIMVFIGYSMIVFRRKPGQEEDGAYFKSNNRLEVIWTIIPLGAVIGLSYLGAVTLGETRQADPAPLEIKVVGGQWFWRFEYPEYGIVSDKMYMPVNRQALLKLTSQDVIHSFWVPEFRVKQDLLPGENLVRELRITPTLEGEYKVRCAEMCGTSHAYMESPVIVVSQQEFDEWVKGELAVMGTDPVARGERWAKNNGCQSCHSVDGTASVGPTWQGLFGKTVTLLDGSTVTVDEAYLLTAIINPNAQVAQGSTPNVMPQTYKDSISEEQISDIVEFIKSLQ
ncbi:MAG: cytochrome c oxidase subunit II [Bellilinea sp.]